MVLEVARAGDKPQTPSSSGSALAAGQGQRKLGMNSKYVISVLAALLVLGAWVFVLSNRYASQKLAPSAAEIKSAYLEVFSRTSCSHGSGKPTAINNPSRVGLRLACDAKVSVNDAAQMHLEQMRKAHYIFLEDSVGPDGIRSVRGCKSGIIAAVNLGMVNGTTKLEQRVHWSRKESESLAKFCGRD